MVKIKILRQEKKYNSKKIFNIIAEIDMDIEDLNCTYRRNNRKSSKTI